MKSLQSLHYNCISHYSFLNKHWVVYYVPGTMKVSEIQRQKCLDPRVQSSAEKQTEK